MHLNNKQWAWKQSNVITNCEQQQQYTINSQGSRRLKEGNMETAVENRRKIFQTQKLNSLILWMELIPLLQWPPQAHRWSVGEECKMVIKKGAVMKRHIGNPLQFQHLVQQSQISKFVRRYCGSYKINPSLNTLKNLPGQ